MKVLLDTTYVRRGPTGTGIYIERIAAAMRGIGIDVVEASNDLRRGPGGGGLRSAGNAAVDAWWTAVEIPRRAKAAGADVIHHPLPALAPLAGCPQVVTVHDLAFERLPEYFDPRYRRYAHLAHRAAARRADAVIAVSQATADDARVCWGIDPARIVVARHGPGQDLPAPPRAPAPSHFLYVGDDEPRKNLGLLLAAYRIYRERAGAPLELVLAGSAAASGDGIRVEARPEAQRLSELYAQAAALVHPSLHEGFGLTLLEAMRAGVPVLAVRSAAAAEVCEDDALYVGPRDAAALADVLERIAGDAPLRADLSERGRRRAAAFSWPRAARAHLQAYELAVARGR